MAKVDTWEVHDAGSTSSGKAGSGRASYRPSIDEEGGGGGSASSGSDDIMLGFQNLSMSSVDPPKHIIANVSGFVVKGESFVKTLRQVKYEHRSAIRSFVATERKKSSCTRSACALTLSY